MRLVISMALAPTLFLALTISAVRGADGPRVERPNVVLVLADDLGYGDLSLTGNPWLRTPHLDSLASSGAWVDPFYVSPVCGTTRAALFTGCYPMRVGVRTNGDPLAPEAVTIAERLAEAGYATGLFGKWHLGEHFPHRPRDQGFETTLVSRGGNLGRLAPQPLLGRYSDPYLERDGVVTSFQGYATDVVVDECLAWIRRMKLEERSFFACLPTHAPHRPFDDTPTALHAELLARLADASLPEGTDVDELARVYAMIENLDANVGRLLAGLRELDLLERTLVVFLSDNGANSPRFSAGLSDGKGSVREGGVRVPFFAHWPGTIPAGRRVEQVAAHIDVVPTLLEACGLPATQDVDGRSLLGLLRAAPGEWPERRIYLEAHQGNKYQPYHNFAVRGPRYKLVRGSGFRKRKGKGRGTPEPLEGASLYDMLADPLESDDRIDVERDVALELWMDYVAHVDWLSETQTSSTGKRVRIGLPEENPVLLTRDNWGRIDELMEEGGGSDGFVRRSWPVRVDRAGEYDVRVNFLPVGEGERLSLQITADSDGRSVSRTARLAEGTTSHLFEDVPLARGPYEVDGEVLARGRDTRPVWQVALELDSPGDG